MIRAALQILVPIFALGVFGFVQLDRHSERFSDVASQAAKEMRLVDSLLTHLDVADAAGYEYLDDGTGSMLARFNRAAERIDAGMAVAVKLSDPAERRPAREANRRWTRVKQRMLVARALRASRRNLPGAFDDAHVADMTATSASVLATLNSSQNQIDEQVAAGRRRRERDRTLLAFQIAVGVLIAAWVVFKLTRETVRPLARLGAAADRLRSGDYAERVQIDGPAELARLGTSFNVMADTLEAQQKGLRQLAYSDPLTGLPNRVTFVERVASAAGTGPSTVLFLDLDDFKSVNDALGHEAGDALLVETAQRIAATVRSSDTVARLGGDEFAVLVPGRMGDDHRREAVKLAERLLRRLSDPLTVAEMQLTPGASVGIAVGQGSAAELLREADAAMYEAKRAGRGRYAFFEPEMQEAASQRLAGIADLRRALEEEQFRLVYQPIVDLRTRVVRATEALVRWEHPVRGLVSPAEFIPLAEQTGLIVGIGQWVLRTACFQAAEWQFRHPDAERSITVNLSTRQLLEPDLVDQVSAALAASGLPPELLVLEITESAVMADPKAASTRLGELRRLGVRLAIDDFGTGYSSLAYLRELPVHDLKIAREFISVMEDSPHDLALARGILLLGHGLGLRVIAEGIETDAQHARLRGMGCNLGQGYLYARPLEADAIGPMLDAGQEAPDLLSFVATTAPDAVYRAAWGRLPDAVVLAFDTELRITMADGLGLERLGWRPEELLGRRPAEVLPPALAKEGAQRWRAALRGERSQVIWPTARGDRRLDVDIGPVRDEDGAVMGGMLVARDVTARVNDARPKVEVSLGAHDSLPA